jgi:hypothetical protein
MNPLRTWMIALERWRNFQSFQPWLMEIIPDLPCYLVTWSTSHVYLILPACRMAAVLPDPPSGIEVQSFDDPVLARRWIAQDVYLRHATVAGRPS